MRRGAPHSSKRFRTPVPNPLRGGSITATAHSMTTESEKVVVGAVKCFAEKPATHGRLDGAAKLFPFGAE